MLDREVTTDEQAWTLVLKRCIHTGSALTPPRTCTRCGERFTSDEAFREAMQAPSRFHPSTDRNDSAFCRDAVYATGSIERIIAYEDALIRLVERAHPDIRGGRLQSVLRFATAEHETRAAIAAMTKLVDESARKKRRSR